MFNWYLLLSLLEFRIVFIIGLIVIGVWIIFLFAKFFAYLSDVPRSINFEVEEERVRDCDAVKAWKTYTCLKRPVWYVILFIFIMAVIFWPTQEKLMKSYIINETFKYLKDNPNAALNPQNMLGSVNELFEVINAGLAKLIELMK